MPERNARDPLVVLTFRHRQSVKDMLDAIRKARGEDDLSPVLRDAVDQYIAAFLASRGKVQAPEAGRIARAA